MIAALADDQLHLPTPCPDAVVGDLVDHLGVFAVRFRAAARKEAGGPTSPPAPPAPPSGANLEPGWRERLSGDLVELADAWSDPTAWEGNTHAGGVEMPAEVVGVVALDELIVHGWDLAVATGQPYDVPTPEIDAAIGFVSAFDAPRDGRLFGPVVPVAEIATPLDRLLSLTGRDPRWQRPARPDDGVR